MVRSILQYTNPIKTIYDPATAIDLINIPVELLSDLGHGVDVLIIIIFG